MLSIKSALAKQDRTPLMVFDEIDANVGGEIARGVGEKMAGQRMEEEQNRGRRESRPLGTAA